MSPGMSQMLRRLRERVQGHPTVKEICCSVFKEYADEDNKMAPDDLQVAVLRVYNSLNKDLLGPHKEPPSRSSIENKSSTIRSQQRKINEEEFYGWVLEWAKGDLHSYLAHKIVLALLGAPALALGTKCVAKRAPIIGGAMEKIPTPVFYSICSVGLVLAQR